MEKYGKKPHYPITHPGNTKANTKVSPGRCGHTHSDLSQGSLGGISQTRSKLLLESPPLPVPWPTPPPLLYDFPVY